MAAVLRLAPLLLPARATQQSAPALWDLAALPSPKCGVESASAARSTGATRPVATATAAATVCPHKPGLLPRAPSCRVAGRGSRGNTTGTTVYSVSTNAHPLHDDYDDMRNAHPLCHDTPNAALSAPIGEALPSLPYDASSPLLCNQMDDLH